MTKGGSESRIDVGYDVHNHFIPNYAVKFGAVGGSTTRVFNFDNGRTSDANNSIANLDDDNADGDDDDEISAPGRPSRSVEPTHRYFLCITSEARC
ncbi:hypothetical protein PV10_06345 [Exophiala mesophila]|uniref:Uncharacterized protein n=1 Tax=Exophiala mesophila TaxID=212818 RepID=A0A0D1ZAZ4_EXOME|nr:uncharacterized protein PV10_06345 [Exophiala mesophila]KIV91852.1 hypothetical protein PV10_06345 [Exophiala mesophila]